MVVVLNVHSELGFISLFTCVSYCMFIDLATMATRNEWTCVQCVDPNRSVPRA